MDKIIVDAVKKIELIHEKMGEEYTFKNKDNEHIEIYDYSNKKIPNDRVENDKNKILTILNETYDTCMRYDKMNDFVILYAIYCNIYIKWGFHARLHEWDKKDNFSLEKYIKNNKDSSYFKNILCGIRDQNYSCFEKILESNPKCKIANLYLFVKYAADICYSVTKDKNEESQEKIKSYEDKMWNYYELLDSDFKDYVLGKGKYHKNVINLAIDENFLPYIDFKSIKEYLIDYIVYNYKLIKRNLEIGEIESGYVFNEIMRKLKIYEPLNVLVEDSKTLKNIKNQRELIPCIMDSFAKITNRLQESSKIINDNILEFTFLFEKLNDISDEDFIENIKFQTGNLKDSNNSLPARNWYLHIPQNINGVTNKHFMDKYKLYCTNREFKKIEGKFKDLINDLNKYAGVSGEEIDFDKSTDKIHEFLNDISANKLKSAVYYDEYENELNKLIVNYRNELNERTLSDIEASRDLSRVAPEKMDLILMPIFRSIEGEIKTRIFDEFFKKFKGLKWNNINNSALGDKDKSKAWRKTEESLKNGKTTLGAIVFYDKEFLYNAKKIYDISEKRSIAFYLKKLLDDAGCAENYYEMIQLLKDYRYNELTFARIRNAIAHRNEDDINKFNENILNDIMGILIKTPEGTIFNMLEIEKAINKLLENNDKYVPSKGMNVKVNSIINKDNKEQSYFELNGFVYNCTQSQNKEGNGIVVGYDDTKNLWVVE